MAHATMTGSIEHDRVSFAALVRELAASGMAAVLAGIAVGGVGGRLAMRLSAMVNPSMTGRLSANGNRIGDITAGGTLALVVFGGVLVGMAAGVAWVAVRPWLPTRLPWRRTAAAVAAVALAGSFVVEADNFDFFILDPAWLHVVMFTAIVAGAGALTDWIDKTLVARLRESRRFTAPASVMLFVGAPITIPLIGSFFSEDMCFCDNPPRIAGVFLVVAAAATALTWAVRWKGAVTPSWLRIVGWGATTGAVVGGLAHVAREIVTIV